MMADAAVSSVDATALQERLAPLGAGLATCLAAYLHDWRPYKPGWVYEDGVIFRGALDLADAAGLPTLRDFVLSRVAPRIAADGSIADYAIEEFNIDNICAGRVLFDLDALTGDPRYRRALAPLAEQLRRHPRTASGNYWHKQIYPYQVWLDGLYMAQPFRVRLSLLEHDEAALQDVARQFAVVERVLRDPGTGLYWHGWDESRREAWSNPHTGCSPHFWGRAMGWFVVAMADILELVDGRPGARHFAALKDQLAAAADALSRVVSANGLWWQVLEHGGLPGNYEETSASLMIADAFMKGARLGALPARFASLGRRAFDAVVAQRIVGGRLTGICGVAGLGNVPYRDGSYDYYVSEPRVDNDPKGVAALMMAAAEALRQPAATR